jgi:hypothetical protein
MYLEEVCFPLWEQYEHVYHELDAGDEHAVRAVLCRMEVRRSQNKIEGYV